MNYQNMWEEMKTTYQERVNRLETNGKKGTTAWINAKRFVDVMEHFELKEGYKKQNHADISINDLRRMAEEL